ncbi:Vacuolar protein sorting-associated protein 8 [Pichia californica]|uniref:Vacuolar protein sorting-associated protein 8 n=1 Tax=Pichia californica TaxID=460514 RepID=A0A9P6WK81_9ASCO|nr:Vacuolar protein sorting-associated protein 8 [[Candida] californica]
MPELISQTFLTETTSHSRNFDQRLSSKLSEQQSPTKSHVDLSIASSLATEISSLNSTSSKQSIKTVPTLATIQWMKLPQISEQVFTSTSKQEHGEATLITVSKEYIAIATSKCNILLFNYKQILLLNVKTSNVVPSTKITSMSLSIDSTYLVVGYSTGFINLWDLRKADPIISLKPITIHELEFNGNHHHIAHLEGSSIRRISFIGSRHTGFISSDESGMMIYHNGGRSLIGYSCRSKIIFGEYNLNSIVTKQKDYTNTILDFHLLPIGSHHSITDEMSLVAIITPHAMVVLSLQPEIKTQIKSVKPKIFDQNLGMSGCVSWYPSITGKNGKQENFPILAYAWSNIVNIIEIQPEYLINNIGEKNIKINVVRKRRVKANESIITLRWISNRVLVGLTRSQKLIFYDCKTLIVLKEVDMIAKQMVHISSFTGNNIGLVEKDFSNSFCTLKSNIFIFQHQNIVIGNLSNWADVLLDLLNKGRYIEALDEAKRQYQGGDDLSLIGLPDDNNSRHDLMKDYLIQIFKSSLKYIFTENSTSDNTVEDFKKTTFLFIQTCLNIKAPFEMYDLIYEKLLENNAGNIFFEVLENFIFSSEIVTLSPEILRAMVIYYIKEEDTNTLEHMICLLDIQQLDIDLTVTLCKQYHLNEALTYIWTTLLHDYFTPLIEAVQRIKRINEEKEHLSEYEIIERKADISYVYPYISYTLTGRQYPTDKLFPYEYSTSAKLNIYYFLFSGSTISWPIGSSKIHTINDYKLEPAFPYLCLFLKYDSESMIASLNEAFEDDLLNDNEMVSSGSTIEEKYQIRVNRQYIIDVLLGIFHDQESEFSTIDNIRLAIFVTRNYPKYLQFVRIADSISDEMISLLCKAGTLQKEDSNITTELIQDCELGLQSLLAVYKPYDVASVIMQVEKAGYYQVLIYLYQVEEMYIDVLKLWIQLQEKMDKLPDYAKQIDLFKPISEFIRDAVIHMSPSEREEIVKALSSNFELIVKSDPKGIAQLVSSLCPELNSSVVNFKDQKIKFEYLREIFNLQGKGKSENGRLISPVLKVEFLKGLIEQKQNSIFSFNSADIVYRQDGKLLNQTKLIESKIENFVLSMDKLNKEVVEVLKADDTDEFETLIKWYIVKNKYQDAIDIICEIINDSGKKMQEKGFSEELDAKIWKCINKAFSLLSIKDTKLFNKTEIGITLKEILLLQIVESSVNDLTNLTNRNADNQIIDVFKRVVQSVFTFVINICRENSSSFNDIFERFLDGSSSHMTTLGDVQMVLKEIFISYCNDRQILECIQTLVDEDIFENLMVLESLKVKGWSPKNIECETCGKKIWGGRIGNWVYESWMNHKLKEITEDKHDNGIVDPEDKAIELYVFQCRHTYHRKCLENMGMVGDKDKKCILCKHN